MFTHPFSSSIIKWQKQYGRHSLPWQIHCTPYHVWLSEIMLQQTHVSTVIPYYERFIKRFPTIKLLAKADIRAVLSFWSGLGYYARARNLHKTALQVMRSFKGEFPSELDSLLAFPGIGRSTAGAISVFAFGIPQPILDGNVKRVFTRYFTIKGAPDNRQVKDKLWKLAETLLPKKEIKAYTQGLMDLGATVCLRNNPLCIKCPLKSGCGAAKTNTQHQFPSKKQNPTKPEKTIYLDIRIRQSKILLVQRSEKGIWGGLLSFPERTQLPHSKSKLLPQIDHTLTHYLLHLKPFISLNPNASGIEDADVRWLTKQAALQGALPAPIRKIITGLDF